MNFEICTDSLKGALVADKYGAKRIELCAALSVGGLTPNFGLIKQCVEKSNIEVHVMIRHKEGGFNYSVEDVEIMKLDIERVNKAGAHGVVFGILDENNEISDLNKELVKLSKLLGLEVTFHRAFDFVPNHEKAIEKIIALGFDRLLTSGLEPTAEQGIDIIRFLQSKYGNQIEIMAGSGICASNVLKIASLGIKNVHFTARKKSNNKPTKLSMGELLVVDEEKIKNIMSLF